MIQKLFLSVGVTFAGQHRDKGDSIRQPLLTIQNTQEITGIYIGETQSKQYINEN